MSEPVADRPLTEPHPERLSPDNPHYQRILTAHAMALELGRTIYVDPLTGLSVLTSSYLADRGSCCESGCRHCPYLV